MIYLKDYVVTVKNGRPAFKNEYHESLWHKFLRQFEGKTGWLTFDPKLPKRSERQNRYYWLYLGIIGEETGYTLDELHEYFKSKFLRHVSKKVFGFMVMISPTTKELSKLEFGEYLDKIIAETGIIPPDASLFSLAPLLQK